MDPADPAPMGGRIGLTFDDGPHTTVTPQILATLHMLGAPTTEQDLMFYWWSR